MPGKLSNFVFRVKVGVARRVVGRKSARLLAKVCMGRKGVEMLNQLYDICKTLIGGNVAEGNEFIDRCLRILTDFSMYSLESKFSEQESSRVFTLINEKITAYNTQFEVLEALSPGFNDVEIPEMETEHQKLFKSSSSQFITDVTSILIETLGHHFEPALLRSIHQVSRVLCQQKVLDQMCYGKSPATLQLQEFLDKVGNGRQLTIRMERNLLGAPLAPPQLPAGAGQSRT